MAPPYLRTVPGGVELALLVQPRASRTRFVGEHAGLLKVQLAAPPVDGEANAALLEFLAKQLGLPRRQLRLAAGDAARRKRVLIQGLDAGRIEAVISAAP